VHLARQLSAAPIQHQHYTEPRCVLSVARRVQPLCQVVSLAVGVYNDRRLAANGQAPDGVGGWVEGVAILIAVLIVAVVTATNDFTKEQQFRALSDINDNVDVKVMRGGSVAQVSTLELVVGDVVVLDAGDKVHEDTRGYTWREIKTRSRLPAL